MENIIVKTQLPIIPPIDPSTVLFGLILGLNLFLPNKFPAIYAKVSVPNEIINISQI